MDQSKALHQLTEAADLISMIEVLTNHAGKEQCASAAWAGLRITLRNIRETIMTSHNVLASDLLARARTRLENSSSASAGVTTPPSLAAVAAPSNDITTATPANLTPVKHAISESGIKLQRKDLRAQLERFVERS